MKKVCSSIKRINYPKIFRIFIYTPAFFCQDAMRWIFIFNEIDKENENENENEKDPEKENEEK